MIKIQRNQIKNLVVNNKTICLKILDTPGQTLFRGLNKICCKNADFVLLIYNITNRSTFNEIKEYHYETMKSIVETASIDIFYNKLQHLSLLELTVINMKTNKSVKKRQGNMLKVLELIHLSYQQRIILTLINYWIIL